MSERKFTPPVSIVIPTWNGRELLERFLPSVVAALDSWPGGGELVIADDGGSDGTREWLAGQYPSARIVASEVNRGFAATANMGVDAAANRIVVLLNNDVEVEREFLEPLVRWFSEEQVFAVCARSLDWDHSTFRDGGKAGYWKRGFWRVWRNYDLERGEEEKPLQWASIYGPGGFTAFDRDKWQQLGGLDSMFAPFNWEDTDICYRGLKRGWDVLYEPDSVVYHSPNTTIGSTSRRMRVRYISRRNRLLFHWKNLTDRWMMEQNLFFSLLTLPLALLRLDLPSLAAFFAAAAKLIPLIQRRRTERREAIVRDNEIRIRFARLEERIQRTPGARLE